MAHFAELDDNNKVLRVIVIADSNTADANGKEKEETGIAFCQSLFGKNTKWVQTSYNSKFRGKFAGAEDFYDADNDLFWTPDGPINPPTDYIDAEVVEPTKALE